MPQSERNFTRLNLGYRSMLPQWYVDHLWETVDRFERTPHLLWTGHRTEHGFPGHPMRQRIFPLSGYLVYKNDGFTIANDEMLVTRCGVKQCCQTAHFMVVQRKRKEAP